MSGREEIKRQRELLDKLEALENALDGVDMVLRTQFGQFGPELPMEVVQSISRRLSPYGYEVARPAPPPERTDW